MDETVLKVGIAGFMHDIGKFADNRVLNVSEEFIRNNADLYQPFYQGRHTHVHALYTAAFIEQMKSVLPPPLNSPDWGEGDAFINLAAMHHKPETPMQWVITVADRISSGWDRDVFESEATPEASGKGYKKTRLLPVLEGLALDSRETRSSPESFEYRYPLRALTPENIFPAKRGEVEPSDREEAEQEYMRLFEGFKQELGSLLHARENLELWFDHFDGLMMRYTAPLPAARAGDVVYDVSLYDHSRSTAALAVAAYLYHRSRGTLEVEAVRNYNDKKFLLVHGDFHGIQSFIFSEHGGTRKFRSKILRGRSFAVSLISELIGDLLCRQMGIPLCCLVLSDAGKCTLIAPNTEEAVQAVEQVEEEVNQWLTRVSLGESAVGLVCSPASPQDFVSGNFKECWERLLLEMEEKKASRLDLDRYGGLVPGYLDGFVNTLEHPLCPFCGKRPSSPDVEGSTLVGDAVSGCALCRDHIFLGKNLVKKNRIAVLDPGADIRDPDNRLFEPFFGRYQVAFLEGNLSDLARSGRLFRYWDLGKRIGSRAALEIAPRFISGYIPVYREEDLYDNRILDGRRPEEKRIERIDRIEVEEPKTFEHIAVTARIPLREGKSRGTEALGVLKADVDQLGMLMACGLPEKRFTLSRLATLSRQLNHYFTVYLPELLRSDSRFNDIYTVFSGGDDLFLIGPWNRVIELARQLRNSFSEYVCRNPEIHISAGIAFHKPQAPLEWLSESSEAAEKASKAAGRNRITMFGKTVTWDELEDLMRIHDRLEKWYENGIVTKAMLYRLNEFIAMAEEEQRVVSGNEVFLADMDCTRWRALLAYTVERNAAKGLRGEERGKMVEEVRNGWAKWLATYGGALRIPLWILLYNNR